MKIHSIKYASPEPDSHYLVDLSDGSTLTVNAYNIDEAKASAQWRLMHPDNPRPIPQVINVTYLWKNI